MPSTSGSSVAASASNKRATRPLRWPTKSPMRQSPTATLAAIAELTLGVDRDF